MTDLSKSQNPVLDTFNQIVKDGYLEDRLEYTHEDLKKMYPYLDDYGVGTLYLLIQNAD